MAMGNGDTTSARRPSARWSLSDHRILVLAITAGAVAANLYYGQTLLVDMAQGLGVGESTIGAIVASTQLSYAVGLVLLVPLGDVADRRRLVSILLAATMVVLAGVATAPNAAVLLIASIMLGLVNVTPQIALPLAVHLSRPADRGRVAGQIMTGLLTGILLSRTVAGIIGGQFGWRTMYGCAAVWTAVLLVACRRALPISPKTTDWAYRDLVANTFLLAVRTRGLRRPMLYGFLAFAVLTGFWTTLPARLSGAPFERGPTAVGLIALIGVGGALAAPRAGRIADMGRGRLVTLCGLLMIASSFCVLAAGRSSLVVLALGVVLLDVGYSAANSANQQRIFASAGETAARLNTIYVVTLFAGGTLGTNAALAIWQQWGWTGVCLFGGLLASAGAAAATTDFDFRGRRVRGDGPTPSEMPTPREQSVN
ncbi:MFS transporter [Parafrankia sp. EUN1f]|uniref:MFS transporter n=1 Tax=Parafrankia sp. EUN1f TaxID=102897 RepID=UPI000A0547E8